MDQGIRVRDTQRADVGALVGLLNEIIAIGGTTALETSFDGDTFAAWFVDGPRVASSVVAVETLNGRLCGFQALDRNPELPPGWIDIATFARRSEPRPGVGRALFAVTRERAAALGFQAINATIRADNGGGLAFYEKMGFRTYATTPAVPLKDGTPVDRIRKRFDLVT